MTGDAGDETLGSHIPWVEKAEAAMTDRRYIIPVDDNVIFYCGKILASDPLNARALVLKKESLTRATNQAQELMNNRRYDKARELYQALLQLPKEEGLSQADLVAQLKKVEFDSYPVVHDHFIGSCKGLLKINSYGLSFLLEARRMVSPTAISNQAPRIRRRRCEDRSESKDLPI